MNLTIGTSNNTLKHLKAQYIAAACGIALAATAVVAGTTWQSSSPQSGHAGSAAANNAQSQSPQQVLYFLVGSEEDASRVNGALSADSYNWVTPMRAEVLVVNTPDQEVRLENTEQEMILAGTLFQVADLRAQPNAVIAPVKSAEKVDLDARIMAGVVSSEHAAWAFDEMSQSANGRDNSAYANETIEQYAAREAAQIGNSAN